jgi:hypothetical protein
MAPENFHNHGPDVALLRAQVRRRYERTRLARAVTAALAAVAVTAPVLTWVDALNVALMLWGLVGAAVFGLVYRGGVSARAALPGFVGGSAACACSVMGQMGGHVCVGGECHDLCMPICAAGGALGGALVAGFVTREKHRAEALASALLVAVPVGALASCNYGVHGAAALLAGLAVAVGSAALVPVRAHG